MDVCPLVVADAQAAKLIQPRKRALDDPPPPLCQGGKGGRVRERRSVNVGRPLILPIVRTYSVSARRMVVEARRCGLAPTA